VTRFKRNAALAHVQELPLSAEGEILCDALVRLSNPKPGAGRKNPYQIPLRRITVAREQGQAPLVLATNDLDSPAQLIAQRYKERWGIELFFKWIKQHLRIKRFFGRSEAAVRIQILTALITYLLLHIYAQAQGSKESLWMLLAQLRAGLFTRPEAETSYYRRRRQEAQKMAEIQGVLFS